MEQDLLFLFEKCPGTLPLYHALEERLRKAVPGMAVKVGKSQASFYLRHQFGCASLLAAKRKKDRPDPYLTVTFGLAYPVESPRIAVKTEPYPNRWTHPPCGPWPRGGDRRRAAGVAAGGGGVCRLEKISRDIFPSWHRKRHPQWDAFFCI